MSSTLPHVPPPTALTDAILDAIDLPTFVVTPNLTIEYANPAGEQFVASSTAFLSRHPMTEFLPPDSPLLTTIAQVARTGRPAKEYGVELGSHRLPTRPVDLTVSPFGDARILVTLQERTTAIAMDRRLTTQGAARTVSGLAAVLAHEIKNPLAGIKGAAQLLSKSVGEPDQELTSLIAEESDRICALVDRMERFGEVKTYARSPVNIHAVLDRVRQIATSGFGSGIEFLIDYDPSLPLVLGHRDELVQLFLNLAKNAADAIGGQVGAKVTFRTSYASGVHLSVPGAMSRASLPIEVRVIDNGPGIPADLQPHIFDPFVSSKRKGQGLGLALVAKILGEHSGVIECDSEPGRTEFRILLPMAAEGDNENEGHVDGR